MARGTTGQLKTRNGIYRLVYMKNGKTTEISLHTGNRKEAEKQRAVIIGNLNKSTALNESLEAVKASLQKQTRKTLLVKDAFDFYMNQPERNPITATTLHGYVTRFNVFAEWIKGKAENVDDVSLALAREFMSYATAGKSPKTFNDYKATLALIWDYCFRAGAASFNPWKEIKSKKVKGHQHTKKDFSLDQVKAIINVATGEMRTLFFIGIYTGMRLKDCILLKWEDIDMARGRIDVEPFKTATTSAVKVTIGIHPELYEALEIAAKGNTSKYVVPKLANTYLTCKGHTVISEPIRKVIEKAGIVTRVTDEGLDRAQVDYGFHSLRHAFVTLSFRNHMPPQIIQEIVGHTNIKMTEHYNHISTDRIVEAIRLFPSIMGSGTGTAQAAPLALPPAEVQEPVTEATESNLKALAAILDHMSKEELTQAAQMINERLAK